MTTHRCPVCEHEVPRLGLDLGPMRCLHCDHGFTPPGEERVRKEAIPTPSRPPTSRTGAPGERTLQVDLSGDFQVRLARWFSLAGTHLFAFALVALFVVGFLAACSIVSAGSFLLFYFLLGRVQVEAGMFLAAVRQLRGEPLFWADPEPNWRGLRSLVLLCLLSPILYFCWLVVLPISISLAIGPFLVPFGSPRFLELVLPLGWIVGFLIGFYFHVRLWFASYLMLDQHLDPLSAVRVSWHFTQGKVMAMGQFILYLIIINCLGAACLGVGLLLSQPFSFLAEAAAYLDATGQLRDPQPEADA